MLQTLTADAVARRRLALDESVRRAAVRAVVDWSAATVVGATMTPAAILTAALGADRGDARLLPAGRAVGPRTAALINGTASHTAELDDIYRDGLYHPGSPTIAAALALAEHVDATGEALLRAVACGYEVGCRVAERINPEHYRFWHTTGTIGTLGAAAAAADLLELDEARFTHALTTATTMAAGLQQAFRSDAMSKPLHAGHAAEAGLLAALAAEQGFTGASDVLDGPVGFITAMAAGAKRRPVPAPEPCITRVTVKKHACCGHTFAAVDAALELRAAGAEWHRTAEIIVETYGAALEIASNPSPRTGFESKFSIEYCVAAALWRGALRVDAFTPEIRSAPEMAKLMSRVRVRHDHEFDALYPRKRGARVRIVADDGEARVRERWTRRGDPDDPLTDDELRAKFDGLVAPLLGDQDADRLARSLWELPRLRSVREVAWAPIVEQRGHVNGSGRTTAAQPVPGGAGR